MHHLMVTNRRRPCAGATLENLQMRYLGFKEFGIADDGTRGGDIFGKNAQSHYGISSLYLLHI